ncbi:unnamed protein product [Orchesella dallaii]|uniref:G1/S-specific cyclin-D2 n=1 Tax=Orchesella dallaii TaxID=48710 RepID=A0ABP1PZ15_9HEXA
MANMLLCTEEMMEDSPDMDSSYATRIREKRILSEQLDFSGVQPKSAYLDNKILDDPRVFASMLKTEETEHSVLNYFKDLQDDITPSMRYEIALWMFQVCEEEGMDEPVFLRSVNYMDKYLAMAKILRNEFQLLAAVCLLLGSKLAGTTITPTRLSYYTAHSVSPDQLRDWEKLVLGILKWDLYNLVSSDFVQHILHRLPQNMWDNEAVKDTIKTLTTYCATDYNFGIHLPSIIASASIAAALGPHVGPKSFEEVLQTIHQVTHIEMDLLRACIDQIKSKVQGAVEENCKSPGKNCPGLPSNSVNTSNCSLNSMETNEEKLVEISQAGTPTDVADIHF